MWHGHFPAFQKWVTIKFLTQKQKHTLFHYLNDLLLQLRCSELPPILYYIKFNKWNKHLNVNYYYSRHNSVWYFTVMKMIKRQKLQWTPQIGLIFWQKTLCIKEVCSFGKNAIPMFTAAVVKRTDLLIRFLILPCITYNKVITVVEF